MTPVQSTPEQTFSCLLVHGRRLSKAVGTALVSACLALAGGLAAQAGAPSDSWKSLSAAQWRADLHYLADNAPRIHKDLFHTMTRAQFEAVVKAFDAQIPSLSADETLVGFMRIGAMISDGHSGVSINDLQLAQAPVRFIQFDDGVYIQAIDSGHADLVGAKLISVGSTDWRAAMAKIGSLVPHDPDNDGEVRTWAAHNFLNVPVVLKGLHLSLSDETATFIVEKEGVRRTLTLGATVHPGKFNLLDFTLDPLPQGWVSAEASGSGAPLSFQRKDKIFWFQPLPERRAVYVAFRGVADEPAETLAQFAKSLSDYLGQHDVQRIIVDIRRNGGGDNTLLRPLLLTLIRSQANHRGGIWVLISRKTFSADQNFVDRLENFAEPIFVGEPTAQNVNFFGDPKILELPNSHVEVALAALWWQDKDPRDHRTATTPEIAVTPRFSDFTSGRDPTLDIALSDAAPASLEDIVESAAPSGLDAVRAAYRQFEQDPRHRFITDDERRLNRAGYALLGERKQTEAVAVFQLNTEVHPQSANAFDSLGEGLEADGKPAAAKVAYTKAVELNAGSEHAKYALKRLGTTSNRPSKKSRGGQ